MFSISKTDDQSGHVAKIEFKNPAKNYTELVCYVRYWACASCAFNELYGLCYDFDSRLPDLIEFLKTQPHMNLGLPTWEAKMFGILPGPGKDGPNLKKLAAHTVSFPNYAHGEHLLNFHFIDLTKV